MTAPPEPRWSLADCPGLEQLPPTGRELPDDDDEEMMPSKLHLLEIVLLMETLRLWMTGRRACFIGGDMFVYYATDQRRRHRFRGPDFFVVLDVPDYPRRNWVIWEEGGRGPDVVVELLSTSTAREDRRTKKQIYQDVLRVPEYYWFDPETAEFQGFQLRERVYQPITAAVVDEMPCETLGLKLVIWEGECFGYRNRWLRWATPDGQLLPTPDEAAALTAQRAGEAEQRAGEAEQRAGEAEQRAADATMLLEQYRRRFGDLGDAPSDGPAAR